MYGICVVKGSILVEEVVMPSGNESKIKVKISGTKMMLARHGHPVGDDREAQGAAGAVPKRE
jgi:hypothetical protein